MTYTFSIDVFASYEVPSRLVATITGEVEAERYSSACIQAWPIIDEECKYLSSEQGCQVSVGELIVMLKGGE